MELFNQEFTVKRLKELASEFCGRTLHVGYVSGPVLGNKLEKAFIQFLEDEANYVELSRRKPCDIPYINTDIKALQVKGKRGGSPKIHGYSRDGPPEYHILLFTYSYRDPLIEVGNAYWIEKHNIVWIRARHYLFSIPHDKLKEWEL